MCSGGGGGAKHGADGPAVSSEARTSPRGPRAPWKEPQQNDMSRWTKQGFSLQTAEMGCSQFKTQIRFLERCEEPPEEGGGAAGPRESGTEQQPLPEARRCTSTRSRSICPHTPDADSQGNGLWPATRYTATTPATEGMNRLTQCGQISGVFQ